MEIIGGILLLIAIMFICRVLRAAFWAVDWIVYILIAAAFVLIWITNGFWMGLLAGVIGLVAARLLFSIGGGTEVRKFGHKYTLTCHNCGYGDLEIVEHTDDGVISRYRRCDYVCHHRLNH